MGYGFLAYFHPWGWPKPTAMSIYRENAADPALTPVEFFIIGRFVNTFHALQDPTRTANFLGTPDY